MTDKEALPIIRFLSEADRRQIYRAALQVLGETGMTVLHGEARSLLQTAGCAVEADDRVRIPESLVRRAVETAPSSIALFNRQGQRAMDLGGYRSYFGTGSDLIYSLDGETLERHPCVLEDVGRAARLCDALANMDFIMSFAHPSDYEPTRAYLASFQAMAENSVKPMVCTAECRDDLGEMWKMAGIIRGGESTLRSEPYFIHYAEPISPLKHPFVSLDKLLFCAEKGIPLIYSPAPIAGSTAPMTIAGHVVLGLAETLCGLVIHQLKNQGAPYIMGMGAAVLDMVTGTCSYNAPEYYLAYMGMIEMSHHLDLPSWGYAGTSDAQIPDGQAAFEAGILTFLSTFSGANLNHDVGYLDFGRTGSLEMIVVCDEIIDQARRLSRGIPVDEDRLGLEAIREVGPNGNFLLHEHTLRHLRTTQWRPTLSNRLSYEKWEESGRLSLLDRAGQQCRAILDRHRPVPIPDDRRRAVQRIVDGFKTG